MAGGDGMPKFIRLLLHVVMHTVALASLPALLALGSVNFMLEHSSFAPAGDEPVEQVRSKMLLHKMA